MNTPWDQQATCASSKREPQDTFDSGANILYLLHRYLYIMLHLGIFVSGNGSNFRAIHASILDGRLDATIELVVSSKEDAPALDYAREQDIPIFVEPKNSLESIGYAVQLLDVLLKHNVDFVALCGYLKLVPLEIVSRFPQRIVNIHPALLPSFGGKGMYGHHVHEAVIASGVKFSGCTVHIVSPEYDKGPIVMQEIVPVSDSDTASSLASKILKLEHVAYSKALQLFARDRLKIMGLRTFLKP